MTHERKYQLRELVVL